MLEVDQSAELALSEDVLLKAFPETGQYYAFDTRNGDHFNLNATAHWILDRIKHNGNFESLVEDFTNAFVLEKEEALRDLSELLEFALENKIIVGRCHNEDKKNV